MLEFRVPGPGEFKVWVPHRLRLDIFLLEISGFGFRV